MKAIRVHQYGGPEVLQLEDVPDPTPGAGQVLVRVKAAGVNPYDTYMRAGSYGATNPTLPFTPGSDAAGVIEALGPGVDGFKVGDPCLHIRLGDRCVRPAGTRLSRAGPSPS